MIKPTDLNCVLFFNRKTDDRNKLLAGIRSAVAVCRRDVEVSLMLARDAFERESPKCNRNNKSVVRTDSFITDRNTSNHKHSCRVLNSSTLIAISLFNFFPRFFFFNFSTDS